MVYHGSEHIRNFVPKDNCEQSSSTKLVKKLIQERKFKNVLDLGCGNGDSVDFFKNQQKDIKWVGLDIETSPEVDSRKRTDVEFRTYDGINIPFPDDYFDLIFCHQVFEHVEKPFELIKEIHRVMNKGAYFVESVSYLEAFHSFSTFNYTPYGFKILLSTVPLELIILRPGIDFLTLNANIQITK